MVTGTQQLGRRRDALSKERIVEAAIAILDAEGENCQLFRALTTRLSTGVGAIYHHVANKNELLAAAASDVIDDVMTDVRGGSNPRQSIRAMSLGIFDAIDSHPWMGAQLARDPSQAAVLRLWEGIGSELRALGIARSALPDAGSALVNYVLGSAAQYAAGARRLPLDADRRAYLVALADRWEQLDPAEYPLMREMASLLAEHDDREQFLAGVDIFLTGISVDERSAAYRYPRPAR